MKSKHKFCRSCWYCIDNIFSNSCPECGREFDINDPKTYRLTTKSRHYHRLFWKIILLLGFCFLLLTAVTIFKKYQTNRAKVEIDKIAGLGTYMTTYNYPAQFWKYAHGQGLPYLEYIYAFTADDEEFSDTKLAKVSHIAPHIAIWDLSSSNITASGIINIQNPSRVKWLNISDTSIKEDDLAFVSRFSNIEILYLDNLDVTTRMIESLKEIKSIHTLSISGSSLNSETFRAIGELSNLGHLVLNQSKMGDDDLRYLNNLNDLLILQVSDASLSNHGLKHLAKITSLKIMYLKNTDISDEGIKHLFQLENLEHVDVSGTAISKSGLMALMKCPKLQVIIAHGTGLTDDIVDACKKIRPDMHIMIAEMEENTEAALDQIAP